MFYYDINYNANLSRLDYAKFVDFGAEALTTRNSYFINQIKSLKTAGEFKVSSEVGRPDVVSYKIYNSFIYYWIILIYNDKLLYDDIKIGDVIKYPSINDVESLYFDTIRRSDVT